MDEKPAIKIERDPFMQGENMYVYYVRGRKEGVFERGPLNIKLP